MLVMRNGFSRPKMGVEVATPAIGVALHRKSASLRPSGSAALPGGSMADRQYRAPVAFGHRVVVATATRQRGEDHAARTAPHCHSRRG